MPFIHGQFPYTFNSDWTDVPVRYLFDSGSMMVIGAEAQMDDQWIGMGEDHLPPLSMHIVSNNIPGTPIHDGLGFPAWTLRYVLYIQWTQDGEDLSAFLSDILHEIALMDDGIIEPFSYTPEVVESLFKLLSSFTHSDVPPPKALGIYNDMKKRLSDPTHYAYYDRRSVFALTTFVLDVIEKVSEQVTPSTSTSR